MFYNYWNYLKFLTTRLFKILKGEYKLYTPLNGYGDNKVKVFCGYYSFSEEEKNRLSSMRGTFVAYRVCWKDGTKSRWFVPGVNDIELKGHYTIEAIMTGDFKK